MARIMIDPQLQKQLHALTETVELCDEQGRAIGCFVPQVDVGAYIPVTLQVRFERLRQRWEERWEAASPDAAISDTPAEAVFPAPSKTVVPVRSEESIKRILA